jgi:hypothetical protein
MNQPTPRRRFTLVIRDVGGGVPLPQRLRAWLKAGLRAFGLRCVRAVEEQPQTDTREEEHDPRA